MIGERFNFEDVFFRDLTVCVLDTLEGQVKWINRFTSGDRYVQVPFYYSLTGDERFLLDSFSDDIVSENRFIELNTDLIPRGHLTMTSFNIKSDEFANPNVWLKMVIENKEEIRKVVLNCYDVEKTFVEESTPDGLQGITKEDMVKYVQYVTDIVLNDFGCETEFKVTNPLEYMSRIGLSSKNNFFEKREGEYTRVDIPTSIDGIFEEEF